MSRRALHLLEAGAVIERPGDERRAHRVCREAAVQTDLLRVLPYDAIDQVRIQELRRKTQFVSITRTRVRVQASSWGVRSRGDWCRRSAWSGSKRRGCMRAFGRAHAQFFYSPPPPLMGQPSYHLYSVPGVISQTDGLETFFSCSNTTDSSIRVGVEVFGPPGGAATNDPRRRMTWARRRVAAWHYPR